MRKAILTLLALGTALPAMAQTPPPPPVAGTPPRLGPIRGAMLMRADANGDGAITRAEALAAADARFDRLDMDRNGTVSPDEVRAARDAMRGRDGDGPPPPPPPTDGARPAPPAPPRMAMTREESRARAMEAFARADTHGDGTVDRAELAGARPMRGPGPRGDRADGDMPPPPPQG